MSVREKDIQRDVSGVVDALREVASRRRELQIRLKRARMVGDVDLAFQLIDELVPDSVLRAHDKKVSSITSRLNGRASGR